MNGCFVRGEGFSSWCGISLAERMINLNKSIYKWANEILRYFLYKDLFYSALIRMLYIICIFQI